MLISLQIFWTSFPHCCFLIQPKNTESSLSRQGVQDRFSMDFYSKIVLSLLRTEIRSQRKATEEGKRMSYSHQKLWMISNVRARTFSLSFRECIQYVNTSKLSVLWILIQKKFKTSTLLNSFHKIKSISASCQAKLPRRFFCYT